MGEMRLYFSDVFEVNADKQQLGLAMLVNNLGGWVAFSNGFLPIFSILSQVSFFGDSQLVDVVENGQRSELMFMEKLQINWSPANSMSL